MTTEQILEQLRNMAALMESSRADVRQAMQEEEALTPEGKANWNYLHGRSEEKDSVINWLNHG